MSGAGHEVAERRQVGERVEPEALEELGVVPYSTASPGPGSRPTSST